jgi:hypothetical protein
MTLGACGDVLRTEKDLLEAGRHPITVRGVVTRKTNVKDRVKGSILCDNANVPDLCTGFSSCLIKIIEWLRAKQWISVPFRKEKAAVEDTVRHDEVH